MTIDVSVEAVPTADVRTALAHAEQLLQAEPALALAQADEILAVFHDNAPAQRLRIAALRMLGRQDEALRSAENLKLAFPQSVLAWLEYGLVLASLGRHALALDAAKRARALDAESPSAWLFLADCLAATGDAAGAAEARGRHLRCAARDPLLIRAADALAGGRLPEAEHLLRRQLWQWPNDTAAIRMLAELAVRIGRNDDADGLLRRCLELLPGFMAARQNLALVLYRSNQPEQALAEIERVLVERPDDAAARNLKAVVLCRVGEYGRAIEIYRGLLQEFPTHARAWLSYGHTLKTHGAREEAIAAYRRSLSLESGFGEAWWSLANLKTFRFQPEDIEAMRKELLRAEIDPEQRAQFEFALGKALEDAGDYATSFEHYRVGNALRRTQQPYRVEETTLRVERAEAVLTPEFFASRQGWGCDARDPIFIVGLPRAGSTLLEQILSSHPEIEGTMELPELITMTRELRQFAEADGAGFYYDALPGLSREQARALGEQYLERTRIQRKTSVPLFIDKMPNNFFHVGLIHLMLPNARIIDARRHPLACCFSGFKQYFARGQVFSYGLEDIGVYYRDYMRLMAHYDRVLPGRVHRVIYERMVDDTETEVRRLLDYCGLAFAPECLRFFENDRPVRTASSEQVRQPIYRDGVDHWRHYEPWLGPLKAALGPVLEAYPDPP